jgi:uncharacterized membrane-anchored protein YitT (DUF2179 family)
MKDRIDISKILSDLNKKNFGRNLFLFVIGMLISALAFNLFFEPNDVMPTGSGGLSFLIAEIVNLDVALTTFVVNVVLLLIGLIFFGYEYALKMVAVTVLYPTFLKSTTLITRFIDLENTSLFLMMIIGGACFGLSSGLIRKSGYNPGGFAVLFDLMKKYLYMGIGTATLIINVILILASTYIFGFNNAIYTCISLIIASYIVDKVIIGISNNKVFYIITDKTYEVRDYIIDKLNYSVTIVNARGGYTNKRKKMLMCVVPTIEYLKLKELVSEIDPNVFFLIVDTYESSVKKNCKNV